MDATKWVWLVLDAQNEAWRVGEEFVILPSMAATASSKESLTELSATIGALQAALEMDIDRTAEDRTFFTTERDTLQVHFNRVFEADQALTKHALLVHVPRQAAIVLGDNVLDRGVRGAKTRMRLELKTSSMPDGADHVFPPIFPK